MRVLVVKLTSMGDVLHLLPALADLVKRHPEIVIDWMVEDSFAELPQWSASVDRIIKVSTRRWRSLKLSNIREFFAFVRQLRQHRYDYVVDAQGLIKSAVFARFAKTSNRGVRLGFSGDSIKESPAAFFYNKKIKVPRQQHAIERLRALFSAGFEYSYDSQKLEYAVFLPQAAVNNDGAIFLFHGTTWASKHVPDQLWRDLADCITADGYTVKLCWGNSAEKRRADWIAQDRVDVHILPKLSLNELAQEISTASGAIAVDTGLGHMAAAVGTPSLSLYGATDAALTGTAGTRQIHKQSGYHCSPCLLKKCDKLSQKVTQPPCYQSLSAINIWQQLRQQIV